MNLILFTIIGIILIILIHYVQYKFGFLLDSNLNHKIKSKNQTALSGGIFFLVTILIAKFIFDLDIDFKLYLTLALFFILGFYSDTIPFLSPKLRLFLQIILLSIFIFFNNIEINKTNIFFIDPLLTNYLFNFLFALLCTVVLLNGSNFADGVNINLIGYYLIVIYLIFLNSNDNNYLIYYIIIFSIFLIFNLFGKCFLGDNGVYVISVLISFIVINFTNQNNLNSIIAINILWYPAFENLFTVLRRLINNISLDKPDRRHLHTLIYKLISKKIKNNLFANSLTGFLLNFYNLTSLYLSFKYAYNLQILFLIIIVNIMTYLIVYFKVLNILSSLELLRK